MSFRFLFLASIAVFSAAGNLSTEEKIWNSLKGKSDDMKFRPGGGEQIPVSIGFKLVSIGELDAKTGSVELSYWINLKWNISHLKWDPNDFGGLKSIHLPSSKIWVPDIVPYRHKMTEFPISSLVVVNSNGLVHWVPHLISKFWFEPKEGPKYPNDRMISYLKFGSWTRNGFDVNLTVQSYDSSSLLAFTSQSSLEASGWKLSNTTIIFESKKYPCCEESYPSVVIRMEIQRNNIYYDLTTTGPGTISGLFIAILYLLPPSSPARIISQTLCLLIATLIGISELQEIGSTLETAPLVNYFIGVMALDFIATFWSIIAAVIWTQCSYNGKRGSSFDSAAFGDKREIVSKLECICCLPSINVKEDCQRMNLEIEEDEESPSVQHLSSIQRFCLALDRMFCVITFITLLFLFVCFRG